MVVGLSFKEEATGLRTLTKVKFHKIDVVLVKHVNTVEFAYNDAFRRSRQNSKLLRAFEFGYIVISPIATLLSVPAVFCSFITTVASFLYSLKCKLGYVESPHKSLRPNMNTVKVTRPIVEP